MFITTLFATAAIAEPVSLSPKIASASLFKNGYAVVIREAELNGSGSYQIDEIPAAVLGTLWVTASKDVKFTELIATRRVVQQESAVGNLAELLRANVNKSLNFVIEGRPESASPTFEVVHVMPDYVLLGAAGTITAYPWSRIRTVSGTKGDLVWKVPTKANVNCYQFKCDAPAKSKIYILALENGLTWSPAYAVDISDPKKLTLTMRATILNDLGPLNNIEVRLITGFPNVPFIGWTDPFSMRQSVQEFTSSLMNLGTPAQMRDRGMMMQNQAGGFGGGRMAENFNQAFSTSDLPGLKAEDLFFYRQPHVTLKQSDRGYYVLLTTQSDYSHIYEWDIPDEVVNDAYNTRAEPTQNAVWHSLKFTNTSKQPLTTAAAVTMKDGEILGQDLLSYSSPGAEARLRITQALDVGVEAAEQELERKPMTEEVTGYRYDLVTLRGTLQIKNRKSDDVNIRITKLVSGELLSSTGDPKAIALGRGLRAMNPRLSLRWEIKLKPGEEKILTYNYRVKLR